jgi:hypothetical protein
MGKVAVVYVKIAKLLKLLNNQSKIKLIKSLIHI